MSSDTDIVIDEKIEQTITIPPKYNVVMLNDDHTPIDWVIDILVRVFKHTREMSEKITLSIHTDGSAVVGTYSYEIAEQKSVEVVNESRSNGFPLQLKIEEE